MAAEAKQSAKEDAENDLDGPIYSLAQKSLKKKAPIPKNDLNGDDAPLDISKVKRKVPLSTLKVKKEQSENDEGDKLPKKKEGLKKSPSYPLKAKKEEHEDDDEQMTLKKNEGVKKRPSNSPKFNKEEFEDDDDKPLKKNVVLKKISQSVKKELLVDSKEEKEAEKSKKRTRREEKNTVVTVKKIVASQEKVKDVKKEKKMFDLPGQKHDPPEIRDPLRIFYETLYEKVPTSEMAAIWMMEWGLLPEEEAQMVYEKKLQKNQRKKFNSPVKITTPVKKKSSSVSVKKKNVKMTTSKTGMKAARKKAVSSHCSEDDDDDFVLKSPVSNKKISS